MAEVWATLAAFGLLVAQEVLQRLRERSQRRRRDRSACPAQPQSEVVHVCPRHVGSIYVIVDGPGGLSAAPGSEGEAQT